MARSGLVCNIGKSARNECFQKYQVFTKAMGNQHLLCIELRINKNNMKTIRRNASLRLATIWVLIGLYFEPLQAQIITSGWGLTGPRELRTRSAVAHPSGGYVLIGEFTDTLAVGSFTLGLPADGRKDAFVLRVDANGQVIWGRAFSGVGTRDAKPGDVACAPTGEIFVSGEVEGDLRQGTDTLPNISTAKKSLYLAAFDALGNRLWWTRETTATTNSELEPKGGLAVTASAVYLAGMLKKSTASYGSFALSNPNNKGVGFIATWSLSGVLQNAHTVVQAGNEGGEINSIGAHPSGLYLAGKVNKVSGTLGHGTTLPIPNTTNNDVEFFAALDFNLGAVWVRTLASSNNKIKSVRVASYPGGGLIGSGEFEQTADFGGLTLIAGTKKAGYVVRFSATGV
ncbi:hypothetical protein, partial [Schleiferia thermophila]